MIKNDVGGNGGLAYYEVGEVNLGTAPEVAVSETGWQAESGYGGQDINYEYYKVKMGILEKTDWDGSGKPSYNPQPDEDWEIYTHTGDVYLDFSPNSTEKLVFMIDGDVLVDSNVTIEVGSHLTVIASGTITFADNVGEVHGWWVADRIIVESTEDEATEIQFQGQGSFVGYDAIELNRDRGILNNTEPSELFTYRPDLMVNAPNALKFSRLVWREVVP